LGPGLRQQAGPQPALAQGKALVREVLLAASCSPQRIERWLAALPDRPRSRLLQWDSGADIRISQSFDYPLVPAWEIEEKIWRRFDGLLSATNYHVQPKDPLIARPAAILVGTFFEMTADLLDAMRRLYAVIPPLLRIPPELEGGTKVFLSVEVADPPTEGVEICQVVHRFTPPAM
jgi:hypothetical protein